MTVQIFALLYYDLQLTVVSVWMNGYAKTVVNINVTCLDTDSSLLRPPRAAAGAHGRGWAGWTAFGPPDWFPTAACACDELLLWH